MMWFGGSIPAAIAAAKQQSSVFVVFVSGEDEQSTEMAARWEDAQVTEAASDGFVAIKIDTKSCITLTGPIDLLEDTLHCLHSVG
uniref:Uncharacterized protein n=1 Tax=Pavo cristatus TaxID=9049 RepID=A0A8C9FDH0_PAVCR